MNSLINFDYEIDRFETINDEVEKLYKKYFILEYLLEL